MFTFFEAVADRVVCSERGNSPAILVYQDCLPTHLDGLQLDRLQVKGPQQSFRKCTSTSKVGQTYRKARQQVQGYLALASYPPVESSSSCDQWRYVGAAQESALTSGSSHGVWDWSRSHAPYVVRLPAYLISSKFSQPNTLLPESRSFP